MSGLSYVDTGDCDHYGAGVRGIDEVVSSLALHPTAAASQKPPRTGLLSQPSFRSWCRGPMASSRGRLLRWQNPGKLLVPLGVVRLLKLKREPLLDRPQTPVTATRGIKERRPVNTDRKSTRLNSSHLG